MTVLLYCIVPAQVSIANAALRGVLKVLEQICTAHFTYNIVALRGRHTDKAPTVVMISYTSRCLSYRNTWHKLVINPVGAITYMVFIEKTCAYQRYYIFFSYSRRKKSF